MNIKRILFIASLIGLAIGSTGINASAVDLNLAGGGNDYIQSAWFSTSSGEQVGSGNFDPFLILQNSSGTEIGYNSDAPNNKLYGETKSGSKSILLTQIPIVYENGIKYYQFRLDVHENNGAGSLISLDILKLYLLDVPNKEGAPNGGWGSTYYNLDVGTNGNSAILLDGNLNEGSGKGVDLYAYIPYFTGVAGRPYLYLYTEFGGYTDPNPDPDQRKSYTVDATFEEWGTDPSLLGNPVPEPMSISLLGLGLLGAIGTGMRRKK